MMSRTALVLLLCSGCTVLPEGFDEELAAADAAAENFAQAGGEPLPPLHADSPLDDWLQHTQRHNATLRAAFHTWSAALQEIPQAATQDTTAMLGLEHRLDGGDALARSGLMLMSDAMANLLLPGRLEDRGRAALERARIAAREFDAERQRLLASVAERYYALALRDAQLALLDELIAIVEVGLPSLTAGLQSGTIGQSALLETEAGLLQLQGERDRLQSDRGALVAALLQIAQVPEPDSGIRAALPEIAAEPTDLSVWLQTALTDNPNLAVRHQRHVARLAELAAAEWQRTPTFSLQGLLMGDGALRLGSALTLPWLRDRAIQASLDQAAARGRAAEAMRQQAEVDAIAAVTMRLAEMQAAASEHRTLAELVAPRLAQNVDIEQTRWSTGQATAAQWLRAESLRITNARALVDLQHRHAVARAGLWLAAGRALAAPSRPADSPD
jgi:outer membrane protein TolC